MQKVNSKHKLTLITIAYWFLLIFIISGWIWWFISLEQQNNKMFDTAVAQIHPGSADYASDYSGFVLDRERKTAQYISEGISFVLITLVGAFLVYRATRNQLILSQQQQNFMMAITHELKTPIAVTQLNLETLQKHELSTEQQHKLISNALFETKRLNVLTNNILTASQLESGNYKLYKQPVNLSELTEESVHDFENRFPNTSFNTSFFPDATIAGEAQLLKILINNLLDNAIKYSPKTSPIEVNVVKKDGKVIIQVANEGERISDEEKKKIFNKFYRSGNESTRTAKGTGLGLYLCKKIMEDHDGQIEVKNKSNNGSIFIATFTSL